MKKQLCRGDIIFHASHAIVIVKWTKTLQSFHKGTFVLIPRLPASPLCPVTALQAMFTQYPVHKNAPLFVSESGVITQYQVRQHLARIVEMLQLDPRMYTFHTFRRSGATLAFNNDVNIQAIKRHGTWSSDTVHRYIMSDPANASLVSDAFKKLFS